MEITLVGVHESHHHHLTILNQLRCVCVCVTGFLTQSCSSTWFLY